MLKGGGENFKTPTPIQLKRNIFKSLFDMRQRRQRQQRQRQRRQHQRIQRQQKQQQRRHRQEKDQKQTVSYWDVRAVSHSCDVFFVNERRI